MDDEKQKDKTLVLFPGNTDISPQTALHMALQEDLKKVIIMGENDKGLFFSCSETSIRDIVYLMYATQKFIDANFGVLKEENLNIGPMSEPPAA